MHNSRRHIVLCAYQLPNESDGGLESATRIFEALAREYDWTFVTTRETRFTERWRAGGARVIVSAFDTQAPRPIQVIQYARWATRILVAAISARADCIHVNDTRAFKAAALSAQLLRLPLLLTVRDTKAQGETYGNHWRQAARQCDRIITLSDEMGGVIADAVGGQRARLRTVHSIVDLARFVPPSESERAECRAALGIAPEEFAIGCIGAIRDKKNQLELIERTGPKLFAAAPTARFHFFGDFHPQEDVYAARCADTVERLGLSERVVFHGHLPDMPQQLKALDAIVIGARNEGLARAMIEGMACGIPVVSFAVCSAQEMLGESGAGRVVRSGDHTALASALVDVAGDSAARVEMGRRGRATAERLFNAERIRARYCEIYDEL